MSELPPPHQAERNDLSPDELQLIARYRHLSKEDQMHIRRMIDALHRTSS